MELFQSAQHNQSWSFLGHHHHRMLSMHRGHLCLHQQIYGSNLGSSRKINMFFFQGSSISIINKMIQPHAYYLSLRSYFAFMCLMLQLCMMTCTQRSTDCKSWIATAEETDKSNNYLHLHTVLLCIYCRHFRHLQHPRNPNNSLLIVLCNHLCSHMHPGTRHNWNIFYGERWNKHLM